MKKTFIVEDVTNLDIAFAVTVDEKDYEKAKELCLEGYTRWHNPECYPEYEFLGYAEPSEILMNDAGIKSIIEDPFEDDTIEYKTAYKDVEKISI